MRSRMQALNMSMRELQRQTGIDIAKISRIANNQILNPSYSNIIKIKNALSISNFDVESCFSNGSSKLITPETAKKFDDNPQLNRLQHILLETTGQTRIIESLKVLTEFMESDSLINVISITFLAGGSFEINVLPFRAAINDEICGLWQSMLAALYSASAVFVVDNIVFSSIIDVFDKPILNKLEIDSVVNRLIDSLYKKQISPKDGSNYLTLLQKYRLITKDKSDRIINALNTVNKVNIRSNAAAAKQINEAGPIINKREVELLKLEQLIDQLKKNDFSEEEQQR